MRERIAHTNVVFQEIDEWSSSYLGMTNIPIQQDLSPDASVVIVDKPLLLTPQSISFWSRRDKISQTGSYELNQGISSPNNRSNYSSVRYELPKTVSQVRLEQVLTHAKDSVFSQTTSCKVA